MNGRDKDIRDMTPEERTAYLKALREKVNKTQSNIAQAVEEAEGKIQNLREEAKTAYTSGIFSQPKNNETHVKVEPKKGKGGCNIL